MILSSSIVRSGVPICFELYISGQVVQLTEGTQLTTMQLPTMKARASNGIVAEVVRNPSNPNVIGLKNLSRNVWYATSTRGRLHNVDPGRSLKLEAGITIQCGGLTGEVRTVQPVALPNARRRPTQLQPLPQPSISSLRRSLLFPLLGMARQQQKALLPGVVTVAFVIALFNSIGRAQEFNIVLSTYIAGMALYLIYRLCGKPKPWWVLLAVPLSTCVIVMSPIWSIIAEVFRNILPGHVENREGSLTAQFVYHFFGAGLAEELVKALPVFAAVWLGARLRLPQREQVGVCEPLDGILIGAASAVGFTLLETLGQYVPEIITKTSQSGEGFGELTGLQLLIPRILGSVAGHIAYSGYFGYFIGLSVIKPNQRWKIISIGYVTAAILHSLWNVSGQVNDLFMFIGGSLAYAFLIAAIAKAHQMSPTASSI